MSHFCVLVVGEDPDKLLESFDENDPSCKKAKWDWYTVGGRWEGFLLNKKGEQVNQCLKKEVDWDQMKKNARKEAEETYDQVHKVIGPYVEDYATFDDLFKVTQNRDEASIIYHKQKILVEFRKAFNYFDITPFLDSRDEYINKEVRDAGVTFAILDEDEWYERGEMLWFGIVKDPKEPEDWVSFYNNYVKKLPDDVLLTVVDCHI